MANNERAYFLSHQQYNGERIVIVLVSFLMLLMIILQQLGPDLPMKYLQLIIMI